jgi:hypothetical protein
MTKVLDLITDALGEIGVLDPGEAVSANDAALGLRLLNRMIQEWNQDQLLVYCINRVTFPLVPGQQGYTLGPGGNFVTTTTIRPGQIEMASVLVGGVEIPVDIVTDEQWRDITVKATSSTFPLVMLPGGEHPLQTLSMWPIPTVVNTIVLYIWNQVSNFAAVTTDVVLPQGYETALYTNLAIRMAPQFRANLKPETVLTAKESKARLKKMNWTPTYRSVDSALSGSDSSIGARSRGYVVD